MMSLQTFGVECVAMHFINFQPRRLFAQRSSVRRIFSASGGWTNRNSECDNKAARPDAETHHFLGGHGGDFRQLLRRRVVAWLSSKAPDPAASSRSYRA
jgi:hypothetical protein